MFPLPYYLPPAPGSTYSTIVYKKMLHKKRTAVPSYYCRCSANYIRLDSRNKRAYYYENAHAEHKNCEEQIFEILTQPHEVAELKQRMTVMEHKIAGLEENMRQMQAERAAAQDYWFNSGVQQAKSKYYEAKAKGKENDVDFESIRLLAPPTPFIQAGIGGMGTEQQQGGSTGGHSHYVDSDLSKYQDPAEGVSSSSLPKISTEKTAKLKYTWFYCPNCLTFADPNVVEEHTCSRVVPKCLELVPEKNKQEESGEQEEKTAPR